MRAAVTQAFGGVDRIVVRDMPRPAPGPGEVLVRVRAVSMNPLDCNLREGRLRFIYWLKPPFVLGVDVAGEVEAVGPGVVRTRPGEAVFGGRRCRSLVLRPKRGDPEDLARLMQSGHAFGRIVVRP